MIGKNKTLLFLLAILAVASFFRLWQLASVPPGVWPDEALNANTAVRILDTGTFQVFYPENHGREGLFFLLISFSFALFGISVWSFKLVPAFLGILTILGQYLFSREFFRLVNLEEKKSQVAALLATLFLAISFWHINFSRIAFRAILVPLIIVFSFYFFFHGIRRKSIRDFIMSGIIFGLGFYSYISFRLAVLALAFVLIFWLSIAVREKWKSRYLFSATALLFAVFVVALPIGIYFLRNPGDFMSRAMGVSIFEQENPVFSFFQSLVSHLAMFNFRGDLNWRHNFSGFPQLSPLAGIFFLIGACWALRRLAFLFKNAAAGRLSEIGGILFLFVLFFSLLLPAVLTIESVPHALRSIGVIPAVYLLAGLGGCLAYQWTEKKWREKELNAVVFKGASFFLLITMVFSPFILYFFVWAENPELEKAFTERFVDVGEELNLLPPENRKYVIENEGDLPAEVPKFIQRTAGRDEALYIRPDQAETIDFSPGDFVLIMNKEIGSLQIVRERFPGGILYEKERIWIYEIR
jgi:4-amino-4-deoxy-L-arabinose transferase-like glycosyltransferase